MLSILMEEFLHGCLALLLSNRADIRCNQGVIPLQVAYALGHQKSVSMLFGYEADENTSSYKRMIQYLIF